MKKRLQYLCGQLQFRLFLSHILVAVLTAVSVTVIVLTFTRTAAGDPSLETYRLVAFDYAKMWLDGNPDGQPTDVAIDPMLGWTLVVSAEDMVLWSRGDTTCRAGMLISKCAPSIPNQNRFYNDQGQQWAEVRVPLVTGDVVLMQRGPIIAEPRLFYGKIVLNGYWQIIIFEALSRGAVSIPIALAFASIIMRPQVKRLLTITHISRRFATGDFQARIDDTHQDDVGRLAQQFDDMADALSQNMRTLQDLARRNADLALQAEQSAVKAERARISRDLHDAIAQRLFSLSVSTTALPDLIAQNVERGIQQAQTIAEIAEQTLLDLRTLLGELRPAAVVERGLAESLRDMFRQWQTVHRIHIDSALMLTGRAIPSAVENAVYQITHEALSNVVRHSRATLVEISLVEGQHQLILSISDNGRGFDTLETTSVAHFGLMSMRERAQMLGGDLHIESQAGTGTTLQVSLPMTHKERK